MSRRYENDAAVEARINEIEAHRASIDPPTFHSGNAPVCLVKRVPIDADWVRRHRTTAEQQQKITEELRAQYGPGVRVSFGAAS